MAFRPLYAQSCKSELHAEEMGRNRRCWVMICAGYMKGGIGLQ